MKKIFIKSEKVKPILLDNENLRKKYPVFDKYFNETKKEVFKIPKKNSVVVSKKFVSYINCPICKSNKKNTLFVYKGFIHSECRTCTHIYVSNPLKENILLNFYKNTNAYQLYILARKSNYLKKYNKMLYEKYFNILKNHLKKKNKILEVGCGTGQFLEFLVKKGLSPKATEFVGGSDKVIPKIIDKKNFFYQTKTSDLPYDNYFDVIFLWGVLEHLRDPFHEMKVLNKKLKVNGKILFLIPNLKSRAFELLGINTPTISPKNHLNFFTHQSFNLLCNKNGFKVKKYFQELPIIDLMYEFIGDKNIELNSILKNDLSYYRVYVIQKVSHKN